MVYSMVRLLLASNINNAHHFPCCCSNQDLPSKFLVFDIKQAYHKLIFLSLQRKCLIAKNKGSTVCCLALKFCEIMASLLYSMHFNVSWVVEFLTQVSKNEVCTPFSENQHTYSKKTRISCTENWRQAVKEKAQFSK